MKEYTVDRSTGIADFCLIHAPWLSDAFEALAIGL
jgi:hypothetical protein